MIAAVKENCVQLYLILQLTHYIVKLGMTSRKGSLHLLNNQSAQQLGISSSAPYKKHRYRGSLHDLALLQGPTMAKSPQSSQRLDFNFMAQESVSFKKTSKPSNKPSQPLQEMSSNKVQGCNKEQSKNEKELSTKRSNQNLGHRHKRHFSTGEETIIKFNSEQKKQIKSSTKSLFNYHYVIGRGGFGKVWRVELKRNKKIYALKEMSKALILAKKSVPSVMGEKKLLSSLRSDFIVNMVQSFQDRQTLYLVMDYLPGGDLRYHFSRKMKFSQAEAKFIIACIYLGLEYLHKKNIIHRDIKPENLVMDEKGYVRITDLGVAKLYRQCNSDDTSGTPGYMAPEVICRQDHTFSVDHFAMGVIAYELMLRKRPYYGRNRKQIRDEILSRQVQVKKNEIPDDWSLEAADFINRLIQRKPSQRLGFQSSEQIRNHPWLRQYPLDKMAKRQFSAPYIPTELCDMEDRGPDKTEFRDLILQHQILLRQPEIQNLFKGYDSAF